MVSCGDLNPELLDAGFYFGPARLEVRVFSLLSHRDSAAIEVIEIAIDHGLIGLLGDGAQHAAGIVCTAVVAGPSVTSAKVNVAQDGEARDGRKLVHRDGVKGGV